MAAVVEDIPEQEGPNSRMCKLCRRDLPTDTPGRLKGKTFQLAPGLWRHGRKTTSKPSSERLLTPRWMDGMPGETVKSVVVHTDCRGTTRLGTASYLGTFACVFRVAESVLRSVAGTFSACPQHAGDFACGRPRHLALAR